MKTLNRNKAVVGMAVWFSLTLVLIILGLSLRLKQAWAVGLSSEVATAVVWVTLLIPFFSFFWTAHHLAIGKGQSSSMLVIGIFGPLAQIITFAILISLPDRFSKNPKRSRFKNCYNSSAERIIHYRMKALPRIIFGFLGIAFAIYLCVFSGQWFEYPENQIASAMVVFLCGYASIINGCHYWVKAKGWNDALVFIGLMPLAVLLIPYVRLVLVLIPMLFLGSMVMMPLILLVVIAALPDKSGMPKPRSFDISKIKGEVKIKSSKN